MLGPVIVDGVEYPSVTFTTNAPDPLPDFYSFGGITYRVTNGRSYTANNEGRWVEVESGGASTPITSPD